jgi:uncharacterized protein YggU (UPF0235/DUF167 family)
MYVKVNVTPGARREYFVERSETIFDAAVKEPAERNMANRRVAELVASYFGVAAGKVRLITGHHSHSKVFDVAIE